MRSAAATKFTQFFTQFEAGNLRLDHLTSNARPGSEALQNERHDMIGMVLSSQTNAG
jgi:hypothetical protein